MAKTIDLRKIAVGKKSYASEKVVEKLKTLKPEGKPHRYHSCNYYNRELGKVVPDSSERPEYTIIYPVDSGICHCPVCLEKFLSENCISDLVIDPLSGGIHYKQDYNPDAYNGEGEVETLHWGMSGETGICHTCERSPKPYY